MGCGASLTDSAGQISDLDGKKDAELPKSSAKVITTRVSSKLSVQCAFVSRCGYYPDALDKPNQDAFTVLPCFNDDSSKMYCGVFDGHGATGDLCAQFARKECPDSLAKLLNIENVSLNEAYTKSFEEANLKLHASCIDDQLSGTTAICMLLDGDVIHVANVGDSRAIIATRVDGKLKAHALSIDQTPYRSDERERVRKAGARVMTVDQLEGIAPMHDSWSQELHGEVDEEGDPPRIWSPHGPFPGTAFTRSIGDELAETLGVIATPEIVTLHLSDDDHFVVLASDGVFEFLTSQAVVDIFTRYKDPVQACEKVAEEAYRLWITYELRTDDITIISVHFTFDKDIFQPRKLFRPESFSMPVRPVRRGMSKEKRRAQMRKDMAQLVKDEDLSFRVTDYTIVKSKEELQMLHKITRGSWLFHQLTQQQRDDIFAVMERIEVKEGQKVIQQGDPGDKFYIVECGVFQVRVRSEVDGNKESTVHTYTESRDQEKQHASFGEIALMHNAPRSSSVIAITGGVLWAIDCRAFRRVFIKAPTSELVQTLQKVDVFKTVTKSQLECIADNLTEVTFQDGEYIITQGEIGNTFYVIKEGSVTCTIVEQDPVSPKKKVSREVLRLKANQYFGERALLTDAPRAANVISVGRTKLLQIDRREFEQVLGSLQEMINQDRLQQKSRHDFETTVKEKRCYMKSKKERRMSLFIRPQEFTFVFIVAILDTGYMAIYKKVTESIEYITVNVFALNQISRDQKVEQFSKYMTMHQRLLVESPLLPLIAKTWVMEGALFAAYDTRIATDLAGLIGGHFLTEDAARIYAAQTLLAIEAFRDAGYIYRNINSDTTLVDVKGYLQFHDFRYMKQLTDDARTYTMCGTPEYMAPEMVSARGHGYTVDIWALGILIYEMLCQSTPFAVAIKNMADEDIAIATYSKISRHQKGEVQFTRTDLSSDAQNIVQELLDPVMETRLGCQGIIDIEKGGSKIRAHPWFSSIDWVELASGQAEIDSASQLSSMFNEQLAIDTQPPYIEPYVDDTEWFMKF